jgi:Protein of unknown function (DUF3160)
LWGLFHQHLPAFPSSCSLLVVALASGCRAITAPHTAPASAHLAAAPRPASPSKVPSAPAWTYWEPVEAPVSAAPLDASDLPPLPAARLTFSAGAEERWTAASPALRQELLARGFVVARPANPSPSLGQFYLSLRDGRVASVVTLDVLFFLTHLALDRALAGVDEYVLGLLPTMLHRLDVRLAAESRGAPPDLVASYVVARGIVAVSLGLGDPAYDGGPPLTRLVAVEKASTVAHAGVAVSPLLGASIDYSAMLPRGVVGMDDGRARWARAVSWLENASLALEGRGERGAHARVDVETARMHARAALLLTHALDDGVEPQAANAWGRIERAGELLVGDAEDITPRDLSAAAARAEMDMRSSAWLANVVRVDRVRHAVARGRLAPVFRLLGPRSTPDGELLQSLTSPAVGPRAASSAPTTWATWTPSIGAESPPTARAGLRVLPSALDVAAWLGSDEARAALRDSSDDAYQRYDETLERLMRARPPEATLASPGRHRTPYLSMIDAIETWLGPSAGDAAHPGALSPEWRKRKADVALAAWTELRHDATALTRLPLASPRVAPGTPEMGTASATAPAPATASAPAPASAPASALAPAPAPAPAPALAPVFIEPHPEAIARLAGVVRQTARALVAERVLEPASPSLRILDEVDDLLWMALGAAVHQTADEPFPAELEAALATFPSRLRALETALSNTGAAEVPMAIDVHADVASARVLEETIGRIDEAWMIVREPGTHRLWLALGASIPHYELVQPASERLSDTDWRRRLQSHGEPPAGVLARGYLVDSRTE